MVFIILLLALVNPGIGQIEIEDEDSKEDINNKEGYFEENPDDVEKELENYISSIEKSNNELKKLEDKIENYEKILEEIALYYSELGNKIDKSSSEISEIGDIMDDKGKEYGQFKENLNELKRKINIDRSEKDYSKNFETNNYFFENIPLILIIIMNIGFFIFIFLYVNKKDLVYIDATKPIKNQSQ